VAIGFGHTATDPVQRAGPYLIRGAADLVPTTALLDDYRGMIPCTVRNCHDVGPRIASSLGGDNGYPLAAFGTLTGAGNPYVYPGNLPRINALPGDGHRIQHCALQPRRIRSAPRRRPRMAPSDRRPDRQPLSLDVNGR